MIKQTAELLIVYFDRFILRRVQFETMKMKTTKLDNA